MSTRIQQMSEIELQVIPDVKKCPFCGGQVFLQNVQRGKKRQLLLGCGECGIQTYSVMIGGISGRDKDDAVADLVKLWNTREEETTPAQEMTPAQKAIETRRQNKKKRAQKIREDQRIHEAMVKSCMSVLDDEGASVEQKLKASEILQWLRKGVKS